MASAPSGKNGPASDIHPEDEKWIRAYESAVLSNFEKEFGAAKDRFKSGEQLFSKFKESVNLLMKEGRQSITKVDAFHNELCIAGRLLVNSKPGYFFSALDYEPRVTNSGKSIDFRATADNGDTVYIDVKTLQPYRTDRWDRSKFKKTICSRTMSLWFFPRAGWEVNYGMGGTQHGPA